jgi:hypothetical protein
LDGIMPGTPKRVDALGVMGRVGAADGEENAT